MRLRLVRQHGTKGFTEGKLFIDDVFECYTVEDEDRQLEHGGVKIAGETAVPKGTYEVILSMSNRFKKVLPEVLNVPQFTGIRIHSGNSSKDSSGCIIVGSTNDRESDDWIGGSRIALQQFQEKLASVPSDTKIYLDIV